MRDTIGVRAVGAKLQQPAADFIPAIQTALVEQRTLRIRYRSFARDEETARDVDPYHLTYFNGGLYLIGHCHLRRAVRIFAVERIRETGLRPTRFTAPDGFDAQAFLDRSWGILQGDLVTVKVVFARAAARYVRERLWHPMQRLRDLEDGRLEFSARVADTLEIRRWILGWGSQAEVLEPVSLREAIQAEAEAVARRLTSSRRPLAAASDRPDAGRIASQRRS
jgi:predicted DNA-binding transcriptional regulator YafY